MRTYRGGWMLIEVLVVLAIILVLAGLVYAVGAYALERSRQTQCISNLRQIGIALLQYMEDHKQADWETEIHSYTGTSNTQERERLVSRWGFPKDLYSLYRSGYLKDERLLYCPVSRVIGQAHYVYSRPDILLRIPPYFQGHVNSWDDRLWVLKQRQHEYPIVVDPDHRNSLNDIYLILRLDGRVERRILPRSESPRSTIQL